MIKRTPLSENNERFRDWFSSLKEEGFGPVEPFNPYNAFDYYSYGTLDGELDSGEHEKEYPFTISGSIAGIDPDGTVTASLTLLVNGEEMSASNTDLRWLLGPSFPEIQMDPESDQFFAYAKTEEDAILLVGLLNHPEELGAVLQETLNK